MYECLVWVTPEGSLMYLLLCPQLHVRGGQECVEEVEETIPGSSPGETSFSLSAITNLCLLITLIMLAI